jgi:hypothetical protein
MKRYTLVITSQGLDAVITLADDPQKANERVKGITEDRARVMYIFEKGNDPYLGKDPTGWHGDQWEHGFQDFARAKQNEIAVSYGSDPIAMYRGYDMRKNVHSDFIEISVKMDPGEMKKLRIGDPYKSAYKILSMAEKGDNAMVVGRRGGMGQDLKLWKRVMKAHT